MHILLLIDDILRFLIRKLCCSWRGHKYLLDEGHVARLRIRFDSKDVYVYCVRCGTLYDVTETDLKKYKECV
jgi:hypothetical protein